MAFTVTSPAFSDGQTIPKQFTCDGDDVPPPMTVTDPPKGAKSFGRPCSDDVAIAVSSRVRQSRAPAPFAPFAPLVPFLTE